MGILELSNFIKEQIKASGISKTEVARRAGICKAELYKLLRGDIRQAKITTFIVGGGLISRACFAGTILRSIAAEFSIAKSDPMTEDFSPFIKG